MSEWVNPGSDAAHDAGCICPTMDNNRGKWAPRPPDGWFIMLDCPVHGGTVETNDDES